MLRIIDARTGDPIEAAPARRGLTRVEVHVPGLDGTALRVLLVADTLVRALELGGTPVWALLDSAEQRPEVRAAAAALGVRPFEDGREVGRGLGGAQAVHVVAEDSTAPDPEGIRVAVAAVAAVDGPAEGAGGAVGAVGLSAEGAEPDVLRFALLSRRRDRTARLDATALQDAHDTLVRWRRAVAAWAREPSRPVPDEVRGELRAAWEDDLDVPGVLRVLREVESSDLPAGARFETYAYADRLLGLELTRDLGAPA
ncbi:hypothetical protein OG866_37255 [Streptomyces sp. NBC_00663]|uniref:hypothetical protein n=1 Tax=Streptomyces sp. NBC_00663 TaxID=2975801 RepID=UPI002E30DBEA|nr:hypothetical protein [Streptomyces sp. NBC_00663]